MTTFAQSRLLQEYLMANGSENPPKPLGPSFPTSSLRDWSTAPIGNPKLEVPPASTDNVFTSDIPLGDVSGIPMSSFRSRPVQAEPNPWASRGPWITAASPRLTSGNTSPNKARDGAPHENAYFPSAQLQTLPAFGGQRDTMPNGHTPANSQGPAIAPPKFDEFHAYKDLSDSASSFFEADTSNRDFRVDRHSSQDAAYLNGISPSANSDPDQQTKEAIYGDFTYGGNPIHAKRPSLAGANGGFPTQGASPRPFRAGQTSDDELPNQFLRDLMRTDRPKRVQNGVANNDSAYNNASQTFQLNPGSQPWENWKGYGNGGQYHQDGYPDSLASPFASKRGAPADRGSPAGGTYLPIGSPKSYAGTPQPQVNNPWPAMASREPRLAPEADRRIQGQQQYLQQPVPYPPHTFFNQNYILPHHHLHAPYGTTHPSLRGPLPVPTIPDYHDPSMNHYLETAGAAMRSNRNLDPAKGIRSHLLEEFRACHKVNSSRYDLKDIYNHVVEFSGDQQGSRFIQDRLKTANSDVKDQIFREIKPNATQLMKDVFGNYVIQKFLEHGSQVHKKVIVGIMKGQFVDLSMQTYACRVVQKILEHALVEDQVELIKELEPVISRVIKDQHGNHVIQKILQMVPREYTGFIINSFRGRVHELSKNIYACRLIQRVLEFGHDADMAMVMEEIDACYGSLLVDQYGNYVTQHVIKHGHPDDRTKMKNLVIADLLTLSKHKFASNVVETCMDYGTPEDLRTIRLVLTTPADDGTDPLPTMIKDQYGNYVIQKYLRLPVNPERAQFALVLEPQLYALKKVSAGKQLTAIDRLIGLLSTPPPETNEPAAFTAPASPTPEADITSAAPTPGLSNGPNSPSSSSPPSTTASAVGEAVSESAKTETSSRDGLTTRPDVRINES